MGHERGHGPHNKREGACWTRACVPSKGFVIVIACRPAMYMVVDVVACLVSEAEVPRRQLEMYRLVMEGSDKQHGAGPPGRDAQSTLRIAKRVLVLVHWGEGRRGSDSPPRPLVQDAPCLPANKSHCVRVCVHVCAVRECVCGCVSACVCVCV